MVFVLPDPPAQTPFVPSEQAARSLLSTVKSPKSVALLGEAIVT